VRTPSLAEHYARIYVESRPPNSPDLPYPYPAEITVEGDSLFQSEDLMAYEVGYRFQPARRLSFDLATFHHDYSGVRGVVNDTPALYLTPTPHLRVPTRLRNVIDAEFNGVELAADWLPSPSLRLRAAYSYWDVAVMPDPGVAQVESSTLAGSNPGHQASLHAVIDPRPGIEFDFVLRYVDELPDLGIKSRTTMDARIGWWPHPSVNLSLTGSNLFNERDFEYVSDLAHVTTRPERRFCAAVTLRP
jgi:iron complex outermembrane receptor protein